MVHQSFTSRLTTLGETYDTETIALSKAHCVSYREHVDPATGKNISYISIPKPYPTFNKDDDALPRTVP